MAPCAYNIRHNKYVGYIEELKGITKSPKEAMKIQFNFEIYVKLYKMFKKVKLLRNYLI